MALPLGVEPRSSVPETNVLSIELQERRSSSLIKIRPFGQLYLLKYKSMQKQLKIVVSH